MDTKEDVERQIQQLERRLEKARQWNRAMYAPLSKTESAQHIFDRLIERKPTTTTATATATANTTSEEYGRPDMSKLPELLAAMESLDGVSFTGYRQHVLPITVTNTDNEAGVEEADEVIGRELTLSGVVHDRFPFEVKLYINEETLQVNSMAIVEMDERVRSIWRSSTPGLDVKKLYDENNGNIRQFMRLYVDTCHLMRNRYLCLRKLCTRYPALFVNNNNNNDDDVDGHGKLDVMISAAASDLEVVANVRGIRIGISWIIKTSLRAQLTRRRQIPEVDEVEMVQNVGLTVQAPLELESRDADGLLHQLPKRFDDLSGKLGPLKALIAIFNALSTA